MGNLNPTRFSHPETLRKIKPAALLAWLRPVRGYFYQRGVFVPETEGAVNYDGLAAVLMNPTPEMPADLMESLYLIHEMATEAGMAAILTAAADRGLELELGEAPTPADVAVQGWLADRKLVEDTHNYQELGRSRAFQYFATDQSPPPEFVAPGPEQLAALELRLSNFYYACKCGRGARVFMYEQAGEWWFLVRHGRPCRREGALNDGEPAVIFYRPQRHDVLVYNPKRGELRMNCTTEREKRVLLRSFGIHLFGNPRQFPEEGKYTLAPLLQQGRDCLACLDVPGIEKVALREVEFRIAGNLRERVRREAKDIFALVEQERMEWPRTLEEVARATLEVKFTDGNKRRRVTIVPPNKALYRRDDDSAKLEELLTRRKFILQKGEAGGGVQGSGFRGQ